MSGDPLSAQVLISELSKHFDISLSCENVVLAMRSENSLRVTRGRRPVFQILENDVWQLCEGEYPKQILRLESRLYEHARQLRGQTLSYLSQRLSGLKVSSWYQLGRVLLKILNCTIVSSIYEDDRQAVMLVDHAQGLSFSSCPATVIYGSKVRVDDIVKFRERIAEHGSDYGIMLSNGHFSRDALVECQDARAVHAYSSRQCAELMLDAGLGVRRQDLSLSFADPSFFRNL